MIEVPYLYTTLWAFKMLITFENKKEINISILNKYREYLLNRINEDERIEFKEINSEEELRLMLEKNPHIFYLSGDILKLQPDIKIDDIEHNIFQIDEMFREEEINTSLFGDANMGKVTFKVLGMDKVLKQKEFWDKTFLDLERQIEEAYNKEDYSNNLAVLLYKRNLLLMHMYASNKALITEGYYLSDEESITIDDDFDYYKESEYIKQGEAYPIDNKVYQNSEFYEDVVEEFDSIQAKIEEPNQYAIFGSLPLFEDRYNEMIQKIRVDDMFGEKEQIDIENIEDIINEQLENYGMDSDDNLVFNLDIFEEEFAFYIIYIYKLNELIEKGFDSLKPIRNRLLYMFDDVKYCLYDKNNFNRFYNEAINYELEEDSFEYFETEAKYFIEDVFEGKENKTIEKLIFISTYYTLTKDKEIIEILNRYKKDSRYEFIKEIILGNGRRNFNNKKR